MTGNRRSLLMLALYAALIFTLTACPDFLSNLPDKTPIVFEADIGMESTLPFGLGEVVFANPYLIGHVGEHELLGYNLSTREEAWRRELEQRVFLKLSENGELLTWPFVEQGDNTANLKVHVLDIASGTDLRTLEIVAPADVLRAIRPETMLLAGDRAYFGGSRGRIFTFEFSADQAKLTASSRISEIFDVSGYADNPEDFYVSQLLLYPDDDSLFATAVTPQGFEGVHQLYRFNPGSGETIWKQQFSPRDMLLTGGRLYLSHGSDLEALDPTDGRVLWRFYSDQSNCDAYPGSLFYDGEKKIMLAPFGGVNVSGATPSGWSVPGILEYRVQDCTSKPTLLGGIVYFGGIDSLIAIDETSHALLSAHANYSRYYVDLSGYTFSDGELIYVLAAGRLTAYQPVTP